MTGFAIQQVPTENQVDSMRAPAASVKWKSSSVENRNPRCSPDQLAEAISQLAKSRKVDESKNEIHQSIYKMAIMEANKMEVSTKLKNINLLKTQIAVIKEQLAECTHCSNRENM